MTFDEADKIFKSWQEYVEIAGKLEKIFSTIPESFLPYPVEILEEALNIVAKRYFDTGDRKMSKTIQETIAAFLWTHEKDETAIESMEKNLDLMLKHPELREVKLAKLKECRDSWAKIKQDK